MRYYLNPFAFEDPQSKREIYRQHQRRNGFYYPEPSPNMECWDPVLMDAIDQNRRLENQQRHRKKRDHEAEWKRFQGDGFDFLVFPPEALQGSKKNRNGALNGRTDRRKPCQVPSPSPTKHAKQHKSSTDPFREVPFGWAPSRRCQRQGDKQDQAADALLELLCSGAAPGGSGPQQQRLHKELDKRNAASASRRKQQQQARQQQGIEREMQEAILKSIFGQPPNSATKRDAANHSAGQPSSEPKRSDRNVTFASSSAAVYQLPQQWHTETTDEACILSIDVTGFSMDDLNLQVVDPIRRGGWAQLTLEGKRTNALGDVWELKRSKTLNAQQYLINAVEATCEDDKILRITIPKKVEPTPTQMYIPIRPAVANVKPDEHAEREDASEEAKPFTIENLFEAMVADFARSKNAAKENEAETKEEEEAGESEGNEEVPSSLEALLQSMADQFEHAYRESIGINPDAKTTTPKSETKKPANEEVTVSLEALFQSMADQFEQAYRENIGMNPDGTTTPKSETKKQVKLSTETTTNQETPKKKPTESEVSLKPSPAFDAEDVAANTATEKKLESKSERLVEEEKASTEPLEPKKEILWERVESAVKDTTTAGDATTEGTPFVEDEDSNTVDENQQTSADVIEAVDKTVEEPQLKNQGEFFDVLESEDPEKLEDGQSWEAVDGFETQS